MANKTSCLLASSAAHEMRTPIHAINGALEMLLDGTAGNLSAHALDVVSLISSANRELAGKVEFCLELLRVIQRKPPTLSPHMLDGFALKDQLGVGSSINRCILVNKADFERLIDLASTLHQAQWHLSQHSLTISHQVLKEDGNNSIKTALFHQLADQNGGVLSALENDKISIDFQLN